MTNVSPQAQTIHDMNFRDVRHKNERAASRPLAVVHNHLHGSDMFIRNQLNSPENITMPVKFQRNLTPSPIGYDSDYYSTSSRGSAITPPPFSRANTVASPDFLHRTELPHRMEHPLTSPTHSTGGCHGRSNSSHQFSIPRPANGAGRIPRTRRRHSSIETSADGPNEIMLEQNSKQHVNTLPSRPQSSASNAQEQVVSNRLNRHKSYYEAVNNETVTSQTIFLRRSERIKTLPEEVSGSTETEATTFSATNTVCTNGINLEMTSQAQDDVHYPSHDYQQSQRDRILSNDCYPQSDSELVTSSPRTRSRRRSNGMAQASSPLLPKQIDAAHPRLLNSTNSTNPSSPLQISQHNSPKSQRHQLDSYVQHGSPQLYNQHRHFSYDGNYTTQQAHAAR